jgi:hypothetical protein
MENSNKLALTSQEVQFRNGEIVNVEIGDLLMFSSDTREVVAIEKENGYIRFVTKGGRYGSDTSLSDVSSYATVLKGCKLEDLENVANSIMAGTFNPDNFKEKDNTNQQAGLLVMNVDLFKDAMVKAKQTEVMVSAIKRLVEQKTDAIRSRMNGVVTHFQKIVKRLNGVIFTLELYAGIKENIKQIQSGTPANDDEPIYLNQLMKFMDEEVGDPSNGGLSFKNLDDFDNWLLAKNDYTNCFNYEFLLPQKKSVRIMRVRRSMSAKYSRDIFNNYWEIQQEMMTYIIIRNGENFYTISSQMEFSEKLFPNEKELTAIYQKSNEEEIFDALEKYKNGMVLMQGLIDRTEVFGSLFGKVSFLTTKSSDEGSVVFQYEMDEDKMITDGSKSFIDFLDTTNVQAGDRILLYQAERDKYRFYNKYYVSDYNYPPSPQDGIYKLDFDKDYNCLYLRYNPKDTVWGKGYSSGERKNRVSYRIDSNEWNTVNIDSVSHRDIDWLTNMLYDRRDRKKYLRAVGMLMSLKKFKVAELEEERPFVLMIMAITKKSELEVLDAVHWWKTKNKHKRPLTQDDAKALRMITKELNRIEK